MWWSEISIGIYSLVYYCKSWRSLVSPPRTEGVSLSNCPSPPPHLLPLTHQHMESTWICNNNCSIWRITPDNFTAITITITPNNFIILERTPYNFTTIAITPRAILQCFLSVLNRKSIKWEMTKHIKYLVTYKRNNILFLFGMDIWVMEMWKSWPVHLYISGGSME